MDFFFGSATHLKFYIEFALQKLPSQKERILFQPVFFQAMLNFWGVVEGLSVLN